MLAEIIWEDVRNLVWLIDQLYHFHYFPCVLTPISVGFCYVLPVSRGTDGSPRLIWNSSGNCQGSRWLHECWKECRCSYLFSPFLYSRLYKIWWRIVQPRILWRRAQDCSCVLFSSPIYRPQRQCLYWSWTWTRPPPPPLFGLNLFSHSHLSGNLIVNGLWYANLGSILSGLICRMPCAPNSKIFLVWPKLVYLGLHCWVHFILYFPAWALPQASHEDEEVPGGPPLQLLGLSSLPLLLPDRLISIT